MAKATTASAKRDRRHVRVRKNLAGTPARPRLVVFRSLKHIYAQVVVDAAARVAVAVVAVRAPDVAARVVAVPAVPAAGAAVPADRAAAVVMAAVGAVAMAAGVADTPAEIARAAISSRTSSRSTVS